MPRAIRGQANHLDIKRRIRSTMTGLETRLLTARETARLMGAPDSYKLPGSYNDGYRAMGDAVAVPVAKWLARYLLAPLAATKDLHEKAKA